MMRIYVEGTSSCPFIASYPTCEAGRVSLFSMPGGVRRDGFATGAPSPTGVAFDDDNERVLVTSAAGALVVRHLSNLVGAERVVLLRD